MNIYIIFGVIVIGLGTLLIYYGASKNDKISQKEIVERLENTQKKIDALKSDPNVNQIEIQEIQDEFSTWATEFLENKQSKRLELEKAELTKKESNIELNKIWKPHISSFLTEIEKILSAYNIKSGEHITYTIPDLPENLYELKDSGYTAKIKFRHDIIWKITITSNTSVFTSMPNFFIDILKDENDRHSSVTDEIILGEVDEKMLLLIIGRNNRFNFKTLPTNYKIEPDVFKQISRKLIEIQLLQL